MANSVDPNQAAPIGAVCSEPTLFASILNSSVMLGNYLQQTTSADDIFRSIFFLALSGLEHVANLPVLYNKLKLDIPAPESHWIRRLFVYDTKKLL